MIFRYEAFTWNTNLPPAETLFTSKYASFHLLTHKTVLLLPQYHITFSHKDSFSPHSQEPQY